MSRYVFIGGMLDGQVLSIPDTDSVVHARDDQGLNHRYARAVSGSARWVRQTPVAKGEAVFLYVGAA